MNSRLLIEPAILIAIVSIAIRLIVKITQFKDLLETINERIDGFALRQNYLYEQLGNLKDSIRQTDVNLTNHIGTEGHIGAVHALRETQERLERLKLFTFQINDRSSNPVDPNKITLS